MRHDCLFEFQRADLDRLNLAAGVILSDPLIIPPELAAELITFKKRVERALPLPDGGQPGYEWPRLLDAGAAAPLVLINPARFPATSPADTAKINAAIRTLEDHGLFIDHDYEAKSDQPSVSRRE